MFKEFVEFLFPANIVGTRTKIAFSSAILALIVASASSIFGFGIAGLIIYLILVFVSFKFAHMI